MKAIIPSAGLGTRLSPLTDFRPKPMFPVVNRPAVDIIIDKLKPLGINKIGINLHHLGIMIKDHLGDGKRRGIDVHYSREEVLMDTGGGLWGFRDFIGEDGDFIVHNCDVITNLEIGKCIDFHLERRPVLTIVLVDLGSRNRVLVDEENRVMDVAASKEQLTKPWQRMGYGSGIFIYSRRIFDILEKYADGKPFSILPVWKELMSERPDDILGYILDGCYWKDLGNLKTYFDIHRDIMSDGKITLLGVKFDDGRWIHSSAIINKGVEMEGFVSIGKGAVIGEKARLKDCIVWDASIVRPGDNKEGCIITPDMEIKVD